MQNFIKLGAAIYISYRVRE